MQRTARMKREQDMMFRSPPFGISCWPVGDSLEHLEAQIIGNKDTPYADGVFKLDIAVPERYPFEPPKIRFITSIYHPNIDSAGRICLDILKMPPAGNWKPSLNISTVLTSIQLLMNEPNPDDPLMTDISNEYKYNKAEYIKHAQDWTRKHAIQKTPQQDKEVLASKYNDVSDDSDDLSDETSEEEDVEDHKPGFRKRTLPNDIKVPVSKHLRT